MSKIYSNIVSENKVREKQKETLQIIADALTKLGKKLYYFSKNSGLEIDFVTNFKNELTLIEVKANNGNAKSLKEVLTKNWLSNTNNYVIKIYILYHCIWLFY